MLRYLVVFMRVELIVKYAARAGTNGCGGDSNH